MNKTTYHFLSIKMRKKIILYDVSSKIIAKCNTNNNNNNNDNDTTVESIVTSADRRSVQLG